MGMLMKLKERKKCIVLLTLLLLLVSVLDVSGVVNCLSIAEPVAPLMTLQTLLTETNSVVTPPMKGMTVNAWSTEAYNSSDFDQSIQNLANVKANWVTFTVFWFMEAHDDTEIHRRPDLYTASDSSLIHAIQKAHELGMKVALKPMVDVVDGTWRGQIAPLNWTLWFENYRNFINHYADLAQTNDVELFIVGTELKSSQLLESEWRKVISNVRTRFLRKITYAANWDSYGTNHIKFWDALDYVGVDAYFPLTNSYNPTLEQLIKAWSCCTASGWWGTGRNWTEELYSTHILTGKKIIFTEIGYCSQDGTNTKPWDWHVSSIADFQEQADCYQAALEAFKNKEWFGGWFWWNWETSPDAGGLTDKHYTPQNKPAENILKQYYAAPNLKVIDVKCSKTIVGQGYPVTINVTLKNQTPGTTTFNITAYANTTTIGTFLNISVQGEVFLTISFTWNTTGFSKGNYTVSIIVSGLPSESGLIENSSSKNWVFLTMVGDITGLHGKPDGRCNILDIATIAKIFGSNRQDSKYNANYDINDDGKIDIIDLTITSRHFGEIDP